MVNFKKIFYIVLSTTLLMNAHVILAKNYEFNHLVVFGDSLSDVGNYSTLIDKHMVPSKMLAVGEKNYTEYLSVLLSGKNIQPSNRGGTNYAVTNATVQSKGNQKTKLTSTEYILSQYLLDQKIHSDDLYIIWAGGNDIGTSLGFFPNYLITENILNPILNFAQILDPSESKPEPEYKQFNYLLANTSIAYMANDLIDHGAKYVMVPNLVDFSLGPRVINGFNYLIIQISYNLLNLNAINPDQLNFSPNYQLFLLIKGALDAFAQSDYKFLNEGINVPEMNHSGSGQEFIRKRQNELNKKYGLIGVLISGLADYFSFATLNFNYFLEQELQKLNDHIIYVDIYQLFNEIIDDPKFYGFDDILLPMCDRFQDANEINCANKKQGIYHQEKNYLWSDTAHPSPLMHQIYAEYMMSILNAPVLIGGVTKHFNTLSSNSGDYVFNTVINLNPIDVVGKILPFTGLSGSIFKIGSPDYYNSRSTNTSNLNFGLIYGVNPNLISGFMFSLGMGSVRPYNHFKYKFNSQIINAFSKYSIDEYWWVTGNVQLGRIDVDDMRRVIPLGYGQHIEKGKTNGSTAGLSLATGYDFHPGEDFILTPYLGLNIHHYQIGAFKEEDNRSTSMRYGKSSTTIKEIKAAIRLTKKIENFSAFAELGLGQAFHNQPIKIKSGLKSTQVSFIREIDFKDQAQLDLSMGFDKKLKNDFHINGNISYKMDQNKNKQINYALGLTFKF